MMVSESSGTRRRWKSQFSLRSGDCLANQPQDLARLGVTFGRFLGEHAFPVDGHFEDTTRGLNQPNLSMGVGIAQLGRQTGGPWLVVSDDAEFDGDGHGVNDSRA